MSVPARLIDSNPWWVDKDRIWRDKYVVVWKNSLVKWFPSLDINMNVDAIYTLRGPRQVGKTTFIKLLIKEMLEKIDPKRIMYYTCDLLTSPRELAELISDYLEWVRTFTNDRVYIFLDEVSSVRDWQKGVKYLADLGKLINVTIIVTGSHTLDVKVASERLPGRRGGEGKLDHTLLPMKFYDYVKIFKEEIINKIKDRQTLLNRILSGDLPKEIVELSIFLNDLNRLLETYLITGGIPKVINEFKNTGKISEETYMIYLDVVRGDLTRWGRREEYLRQIIERVIETIATPVSWNTLKKDTDIASHNTVAEYIDSLKDSFILTYLYQFDVSKKRPFYQKEKKIHFQDPFIFHVMRSWVTGKEPYTYALEFLSDTTNVGKLVEGTVVSHLDGKIFYWKREREVDIIFNNIPVEVKYQNEIARDDLYGIIDYRKTLGKKIPGILLSKDLIQTRDNIIILPTSIFLLLT